MAREQPIGNRYRRFINKIDRKLNKQQKLQQSTGVTMKQKQNNNKATAEHNENDNICINTTINKYNKKISNKKHQKSIEISKNEHQQAQTDNNQPVDQQNNRARQQKQN
jgi:hypothetical protein